jgi:hypothetical protein
MSPLRFRKADPNGKAKGEKERRRGSDRRRSRERRRAGERRRRDGDRHTRELYRSDLDRHLWSWASSKTSRKKRKRRKATGVAASVAGALGAVGLSWFLYKKIRGEEREDDPIGEQVDLDEADFDE